MPIGPDDLRRLAHTFNWAVWQQRLRTAIEEPFVGIAIEQGEREADRYDLTFDADDPEVAQWFDRYLGDRITQLETTTREQVADVLGRSLVEGESVAETADHLLAAVGDAAAWSPARALMIARTEASTAFNVGAGLVYRRNGIDHVEISDGDQDEACAEANGEIWTVDEFLANPLEHPNCTRSATPVLDADIEDEESAA